MAFEKLNFRKIVFRKLVFGKMDIREKISEKQTPGNWYLGKWTFERKKCGKTDFGRFDLGFWAVTNSTNIHIRMFEAYFVNKI